MTELDEEIALYTLFCKAVKDVADYGVDDTDISEETENSIFVFPFPETAPDSDESFSFFANGYMDYDTACDILDFDESVEARNEILVEGSKWLNPPSLQLYGGNGDRAWNADYDNNVYPALVLMGRAR